jgi:two-component system chemotaxis response regulator CheB
MSVGQFAADSNKPIKVMLVDDSVIVRSLISRILKESDDIEVVAMAENGKDALDKLSLTKPDVILLDHEMPVMTGLEAIPVILAQYPSVKIILCSALSEKDADITIQGLSLGASDFVLKPSSLTGDDSKNKFKDNMLDRIYSITKRKKNQRFSTQATGNIKLLTDRPITRMPPAIAIASSTGGPNALLKMFSLLNRAPMPIFITQHMPKTFTKILADQISKCGINPCVEAEDGMIPQAGHVYIAPGDFHMEVVLEKNTPVIKLNQNPPENFCRPAADPMLRSLVKTYGDHLLTVILTGMGQDGLEGAKLVTNHGGHVFAQDEESSIVWGMPGAVAKAGICNLVAPIPALTDRINTVMNLAVKR